MEEERQPQAVMGMAEEEGLEEGGAQAEQGAGQQQQHHHHHNSEALHEAHVAHHHHHHHHQHELEQQQQEQEQQQEDAAGAGHLNPRPDANVHEPGQEFLVLAHDHNNHDHSQHDHDHHHDHQQHHPHQHLAGEPNAEGQELPPDQAHQPQQQQPPHHGHTTAAAVAAAAAAAAAASHASKAKRVQTRRSWTPEEDKRLVELVNSESANCWSQIANQLEGRVGKQCRERWRNHLDPCIRRDAFTPEEDERILELVQELGTRWSKIAQRLPGRTENAVKNRYHCFLKNRSVPGAGKRGRDDKDSPLAALHGAKHSNKRARLDAKDYDGVGGGFEADGDAKPTDEGSFLCNLLGCGKHFGQLSHLLAHRLTHFADGRHPAVLHTGVVQVPVPGADHHHHHHDHDHDHDHDQRAPPPPPAEGDTGLLVRALDGLVDELLSQVQPRHDDVAAGAFQHQIPDHFDPHPHHHHHPHDDDGGHHHHHHHGGGGAEQGDGHGGGLDDDEEDDEAKNLKAAAHMFPSGAGVLKAEHSASDALQPA